jgi:hypothetical protein
MFLPPSETPVFVSWDFPTNASHAKDIQPHPRPASPNTGNPKLDQKYEQQQEKLYARQEQDHQKLQQKTRAGPPAAVATGEPSEKSANRTEAPATDAANGRKTHAAAAKLAEQTAAGKPKSVQAQ